MVHIKGRIRSGISTTVKALQYGEITKIYHFPNGRNVRIAVLCCFIGRQIIGPVLRSWVFASNKISTLNPKLTFAGLFNQFALAL